MRKLLATIGFLAVGVPGTTSADAIDGHWCFQDGRSFSIEGPRIVTPGGNAINGDYDRHGFAYVVPANETPAGANVIMSLLSDDLLDVQIQTDASRGPVQRWKRCAAPTS